MNPKNPLDSIFYITIPEDYAFSHEAMKVDAKIPLPVQKKDGQEDKTPDLNDITTEQILAGILTVLAYDHHNENLEYYRTVIKNARPNILKELGETAVLKARNEDFELAEEIFMALLGLEPDNASIILNMALFLDTRADNYRRSGLEEDADAYDADAIKYYKRAMEAEPPIPDAYFNAGFYYLKQNNYREAKDCFDSYITLTCETPDEELGEEGIYKKERAQEILNNISKTNMDDVHFQKAYELISKGKEQEGMDEILFFIKNNPKVWNAWFMLGWALRKVERFTDAKNAFEESLKCPEGDKNAETYNELALCLLQEKDFDGAEKNMMKSFELDPENTKVISNLGYLALARGDKEMAQKYFTTVLEYAPNDAIAAAELAKLEADE
ncbi:MAG: tetratricopeptide repeat protein [Treponema sp.]|nr:tetratricopeptide repeat protein [Treponema sp.]